MDGATSKQGRREMVFISPSPESDFVEAFLQSSCYAFPQLGWIANPWFPDAELDLLTAPAFPAAGKPTSPSLQSSDRVSATFC